MLCNLFFGCRAPFFDVPQAWSVGVEGPCLEAARGRLACLDHLATVLPISWRLGHHGAVPTVAAPSPDAVTTATSRARQGDLPLRELLSLEGMPLDRLLVPSLALAVTVAVGPSGPGGVSNGHGVGYLAENLVEGSGYGSSGSGDGVGSARDCLEGDEARRRALRERLRERRVQRCGGRPADGGVALDVVDSSRSGSQSGVVVTCTGSEPVFQEVSLCGEDSHCASSVSASADASPNLSADASADDASADASADAYAEAANAFASSSAKVRSSSEGNEAFALGSEYETLLKMRSREQAKFGQCARPGSFDPILEPEVRIVVGERMSVHFGAAVRRRSQNSSSLYLQLSPMVMRLDDAWRFKFVDVDGDGLANATVFSDAAPDSVRWGPQPERFFRLRTCEPKVDFGGECLRSRRSAICCSAAFEGACGAAVGSGACFQETVCFNEKGIYLIGLRCAYCDRPDIDARTSALVCSKPLRVVVSAP